MPYTRRRTWPDADRDYVTEPFPHFLHPGEQTKPRDGSPRASLGARRLGGVVNARKKPRRKQNTEAFLKFRKVGGGERHPSKA